MGRQFANQPQDKKRKLTQEEEMLLQMSLKFKKTIKTGHLERVFVFILEHIPCEI